MDKIKVKDSMSLYRDEQSGAILNCSDSEYDSCLLYTSPSPRDGLLSRMPSSA